MIKDSLGIQVVPTSEYFYYLGRGNNAKLVNELLKKRGWTRT